MSRNRHDLIADSKEYDIQNMNSESINSSVDEPEVKVKLAKKKIKKAMPQEPKL